MGRDALIAIADGAYYEACAPLFIWAALRAAPESKIIICFRGAVPAKVRLAVEGLKGADDRVVYAERLGAGLPRDPKTTKMLRWTLSADEFKGATRAWIGDVDILLAPELIALHDQHQIHASKMGLPYSNVLIHDQHGPMLSGLHWIDVDRYLKALAGGMAHASKAIRSGDAQRRWRRDRHLLHHIIESSDVALPGVDCTETRSEQAMFRPSDPCFRPHHGLHLRLWDDAALKKTLWLRSSPAYRSYKRLLAPVLNSPDSGMPSIDHPRLKKHLKNLMLEVSS